MPNEQNITRPISLIGLGRSGTSMLHMIFEAHPDIDAVGETGSMIFDVWHATNHALGNIRSPIRDNFARSRCQASVHSVFETLLPSPKPVWMHKPIGVPASYRYWVESGRSDEDFSKWYWYVFNACFPESTTFTVLRHPFDYVASAQAYWGVTQEDAWSHLSLFSRIFGSEDAKLFCAIDFDVLSQDPAAGIEKIFNAVDLEIPDKLSDIVKIRYAERQGRAIGNEISNEQKKQAFAYHDQWRDINIELARQNCEAVTQCWTKLGFQFSGGSIEDWISEHSFSCKMRSEEPQSSTELENYDSLRGQVESLQRDARSLLKQNDGLSLIIEERSNQVLELKSWVENRDSVIGELQEWIGKLEASIAELKAWIDNRERVIAEQKAWIEELEAAKRWLEGQCAYWKQAMVNAQAQ